MREFSGAEREQHHGRAAERKVHERKPDGEGNTNAIEGLVIGGRPRSSEKGQGGNRSARTRADDQGKPLQDANLTGGVVAVAGQNCIAGP